VEQGTAKARYLELIPRRDPFLKRAREGAALTVPSLMPPEGFSTTSVLPQPFQGLGSRLVVNLASRLMTALFPAGRPFLRLGVSAQALLKAQMDSVPEDLERSMVLTERIITDETERRGWRQPTNTSLEHLIVTGNALEYLQPDNTIRIYRLDQFCVVRDPSGRLIEFVICDALDPNSLHGQLRDLHQSSVGYSQQQPSNGGVAGKSVDLYTWGRLTDDGRTWEVHQELTEELVPGTAGTYDDSVLPYLPLRWAGVAGEDYGRGKVEEHLPDLRTLDGLTMAMIDGAAMASRNITMIKPSAAAGINLRRKLNKAKNGDYVIGNPEDVQMLTFTNGSGLQITQVEIASLRQELSIAFLLGQSAIRNAERVTTVEVRMVAQELEAALGGVYSMLSHDMMARRVRRLIVQMQAEQELPPWPQGTIEPTILTGMEALGREAQVQNVVAAGQLVASMPPDGQDYIKWDVLLKKGFNGLNLSDAVRTEEEAQQVRQQRSQMQAAQDAFPNVANTAAQAALNPPQ
jgi:hypothetical protein